MWAENISKAVTLGSDSLKTSDTIKCNQRMLILGVLYKSEKNLSKISLVFKEIRHS